MTRAAGGWSERLRSLLLTTSDGQEEFEFWGQLVFGVEPIREVYPSNTAVGVDLNSIETGKVKKLREIISTAIKIDGLTFK